MKELNHLLEYFNTKKFIVEVCGLSIHGLNKRLKGKGTNPADKQTQPTEKEKQAMYVGLDVMKDKIEKAQDELKANDFKQLTA